MSQLSSIGANRSAADQPFGSANTLNDLDLDDFLNLMIAELQNQDPLNPLENDELIAQISQIREVGATDRLTETLDAVLLGQNIASATNLIGAEIDALSDDFQRVQGVVGRVSVADGQPKLHLDLGPQAAASSEPGSIEAGAYEYRVAWTENGTLFALDPLNGGKLTLTGTSGVDAAVQLRNLPTTPGVKQVYRRDATSGGAFFLVDTLSDGKQATYLDTKAREELSGATLMVTSERKFQVSLKNVSEIRPPRT
jgi:flagellar basal-body rod modification protein FlgD